MPKTPLLVDQIIIRNASGNGIFNEAGATVVDQDGNIDAPVTTDNLTTTGNTTLGSDSADALTVPSTSTFSASVTINETLITYKDNATSQRLKGPSSPNDPSAGADVQNYAGMFYNDAYSTVGTLKTRASYGANLEMDLAFQSPHALLLIAQDGSQTDGVIKACTQNGFEIHARYSAEELSPKRIVVDRVDTGTYGSANTSDVTLSSNSGSIYLNYGSTSGVPVAPSMTNAQILNLGAINGGFAYDSTNNKFMVCENGSWANVI